MNSIYFKSLAILGSVMLPCVCLAQTEKGPDVFSNPSVADVTAANPGVMPEKWTFEDCVAWASSNSVDIRNSILNILQVDENIGAAKDAWLPQIKSNELNKEIYEYDIKIAKTGRLPEIGLSGGVGTGYTSGGSSWGSQMGHRFNENVGVNFSIPIYDGNSTKRKVAQAKIFGFYPAAKASNLDPIEAIRYE